jgi:hypothetical protein
MAKDLTEALHAMTVEAQGQSTRVDKVLPAVKEATAIPTRSGSSGPVGAGSGGTGFVLNGEKTVSSTDGLLTFYFPDTLRATIGVTTVDVGVIVKTGP